jgi:Zn-dependent protease with chaperone function/Flp pilus assembly protein TadD
VRRFACLSLLIVACLWFTLRDLVSGLPDAQDVFDGAAAVDYQDPDKAIEALSRVIDRQNVELQPDARLATTYRMRGSFRLLKHDVQLALDDFDEALRLNPDEITTRYGRAECFRQLGDPERADAELQQAGTVDVGDVFPGLKQVASWGADVAAALSRPAGAWLLVAAAWALCTAINAAIGWRQTAEASGSVRRLAYVAAGLGLVEVLPLGVWATFADCQSTAQVHIGLTAGATLLSLIGTIRMLQPPVHLRGTAEKLPRVDDPAFLNRVAELAHKMNVPVPLVRLWPSISGSQQALAFAGTVQAPQLVITDGILHRLSAAERDAVVAHELGHIANGSLWLYTMVLPVTCAAATAVGAFYPLAIVVPFAIALFVGLRRAVSRPLELDSDRRAARAIGFRETAAALTKIHAVHALGNRGPLPLLVYATATHPSRDVRLWSLATAAPADYLPASALCAPAVRRHRIAAATAFAVWVVVLVGTLAAAAWAPALPFLAAPLWIVGLTPLGLLGLAQRREAALERRRLGRTRLRTFLVVVALLACAVLACFPETVEVIMRPLAWLEGSAYFLLFPLMLAGVWILGTFWFKRWQETRKLRGAVAVAFQVHDFRRVLEIGKSAAAVVVRDPQLCYNIAFARAVCGDSAGAIGDFERLWRDQPGLPLTAITLSVLLLDADQPERALDVARSATERLPDDAMPLLLVARSLRRLGRLEEAKKACERALVLEPGGGKAHALAAAIALDQGDIVGAQQRIESALELGPGEPYILLVRAEIVLRSQPCEDPRATVDEACSAVRSNPFAFYRADIRRLEELSRQSLQRDPQDTAAEADLAGWDLACQR